MKQEYNKVETVVEDNVDVLNPAAQDLVEGDTELKEWLVQYVGAKLQPKGDEVTVEMIIEVLAAEFPEFLLVVAEENFLRGYAQGIYDIRHEDADSSALKNNEE